MHVTSPIPYFLLVVTPEFLSSLISIVSSACREDVPYRDRGPQDPHARFGDLFGVLIIEREAQPERYVDLLMERLKT
ncbi:MAG: hypothetical protein ACTSXJ_10835 [Candidatus Baldrarchaeia archaeon]